MLKEDEGLALRTAPRPFRRNSADIGHVLVLSLFSVGSDWQTVRIHDGQVGRRCGCVQRGEQRAVAILESEILLETVFEPDSQHFVKVAEGIIHLVANDAKFSAPVHRGQVPRAITWWLARRTGQLDQVMTVF